MTESYSIVYPRKRIARVFLRLLGRFFMPFLAQIRIMGQENFPKQGPLILVGNHVAIVEVMMMALYVPYLIEVVATGDIPIDRRFRWLTQVWGILPVNRGSADRNEMRLPIDVLKQGGVVGIFPEGGIWEGSKKPPRTGAAWLSYHSQVPILPIGFGGMRGALRAILQFKRPKLVMNIGQLMPPIEGQVEGMSRKQALEDGARAVMEAINALVPEEDRRGDSRGDEEQFDFNLTRHRMNGTGRVADEAELEHRQALGMFFHRPVILDVMARNMKLPVKPLQQLHKVHDPQVIAAAIQVALGFLEDHPQFLSYRFGYPAAEGMRRGLEELQAVMQASAAAGETVSLRPVRQYVDRETGECIVQTLQGQHGNY